MLFSRLRKGAFYIIFNPRLNEKPRDVHLYCTLMACGNYNRATSYRFVKILEFTHFCSFFNFGRTDVKRNKKQIVDRIHVVVGYRVDTRDTIFFDE